MEAYRTQRCGNPLASQKQGNVGLFGMDVLRSGRLHLPQGIIFLAALRPRGLLRPLRRASLMAVS